LDLLGVRLPKEEDAATTSVSATIMLLLVVIKVTICAILSPLYFTFHCDTGNIATINKTFAVSVIITSNDNQ